LSTLVFNFGVPFCSAATSPVVINDGKNFTNSPTVTLNLNVSAVFVNGANPEMSINNSESSAWTNWEPYNSPKTWALTPGDGLKTVYVKFRVVTGYIATVAPPIPIYQTSIICQASVTLDTTPPTLTITNPAINGTQIGSSTLQVSWTATDTGSGLNYTAVVDPNGNFIDVGANTTYTFTGLSNGNYAFGVEAVDNVGNAATTSLTFTVNIAPPTPTPTPQAPTPSPSQSPTPTPTGAGVSLWPIIVAIAVAAGIIVSTALVLKKKSNDEKDKRPKIMIWPTYFDSAKPRNKGRRVPKNLSVKSPRTAEIMEAVKQLGLRYKVPNGAGGRSTLWLQTGMILVEKKGSKAQTIRMIVKQIPGSRGALPNPLPKPPQESKGALPDPLPKPSQESKACDPIPMPKPPQGAKASDPIPLPKPAQGAKRARARKRKRSSEKRDTSTQSSS
jgi:signal recognition particle subunit SEC65